MAQKLVDLSIGFFLKEIKPSDNLFFYRTGEENSMWICRECKIKFGDGAQACTNCGGKKEEVGAVINPALSSSQAWKKNLKRKVNPLFAIIAVLILPFIIYIQTSRALDTDDPKWERSQAEQAIVRVNSALDQEERGNEKKGAGNEAIQNYDYLKTLIVDSAQIAFKYFSPDELNRFSAFLDHSHSDLLTDGEINGMESLITAKSGQWSSEENDKIRMLVKFLKSKPKKMSAEQRTPLIQEIRDLYKNKVPEKQMTDLSRIFQAMRFEQKLVLTLARIGQKYLSEAKTNEFKVLLDHLGSQTIEDKAKIKALLNEISRKCGSDEKYILSYFLKNVSL